MSRTESSTKVAEQLALARGNRSGVRTKLGHRWQSVLAARESAVAFGLLFALSMLVLVTFDQAGSNDAATANSGWTPILAAGFSMVGALIAAWGLRPSTWEVVPTEAENGLATYPEGSVPPVCEPLRQLADAEVRVLSVLLQSSESDRFTSLLDEVLELLDSPNGMIGYIREADGALVCPAFTGDVYPKAMVEDGCAIIPRAIWGGLWGRVLTSGRSEYKNGHLVVPDQHLPIRRAMAAAIMADNRLIGSIVVANRDVDYTDCDLRMLDRIAAILGMVLGRTLERDVALAELRNANRQLAISEARLSQALVCGQGGFLDWNPANQRLVFSNEFLGLLGYSREDAPTGPVALDDLLHADDRERVASLVAKAREEWVPLEIDCRLRRADGTVRWFQVRGHHVFADSESTTRLLAVAFDMTDRKLIEEVRIEHLDEMEDAWSRLSRQAELLEEQAVSLALARDRAEAADQAKTVFLANMSHEIRTPLTAILGYADLLPEMIDLENQDEEVREGLQSIATNGHRLLEVIGDILDLTDDQSKLGQPSLSRQQLDLRTILDSVASAYRVRAQEKNLKLSVVWSPDTPARIISDGHRLRQILMKLVDNAIKFTNHGEIVIETGLHDNTLEIAVQDTGIGIPAEFCRRLFQPFLQADGSTTRQHQGMGLGLVLARQFAEAIGGRVNVVSRSGAGSKFILTLPVRVGGETGDSRSVNSSTLPAIGSGAHGHAARDVQSEESLSGLHILIADDIEANRRFLGFAAEKSGATVATATDGRDAVERVQFAASQERPYDVIFMDLHMPVLNGIEAIRQLRENGYGGAIIALSADAQLATRQKCLEAGADETLTKPISRADLVRHCRELLNRVRVNA